MKYFLAVFLILVICSCTVQKEAFVFVESQKAGRTTEGYYYLDVTVKNTGEQPGYFVILITDAFRGKVVAQHIEKAYGDIFPNEKKEMRLIFNNFGVAEPDSVAMKITYSPNIINN